MRHGRTFAIACLLLGAGLAPAQEQFPPPPPAPVPAGTAPPPLPPAIIQPPPPGAPPPYPAPSGVVMVPPYPPPFAAGDPGGVAPPVVVRDPGNPGFWVGVDGLLWWTKSAPLPVPVVTTGPASQGANAGNLGVPGTTSLNGRLNHDFAGGARLFLGGWLEPDHVLGVDGSLFFLGRQSGGFGVSDPSRAGNFVLNEPLIGAPFNTQVSAPGTATGGAVVDATSRFWGGDINLLYNLYRGHGWTVNLLGGYRYLELDETLTVASNSTLFTGATYTDGMGNVLATAPPGSTVTVIDQFRTRNQFNGGQIGAAYQYLAGRWSVGGVAKLGIGDTHEVLTVSGVTNVFPVNGAPVPLLGGNYASLQIGRYGRDRFALAPETQLNVGYQFLPGLRGQVGYNFLYLSSVARPGNQIDNSYDGAAHPAVPWVGSSYWGQGLNLSVQFSF